MSISNVLSDQAMQVVSAAMLSAAATWGAMTVTIDHKADTEDVVKLEVKMDAVMRSNQRIERAIERLHEKVDEKADKP